jgi:peptidyl-prolyl cis-trans isomerase B (cyclophilin B)
MTKKLIAISTIFIILFSLSACDDTSTTKDTKSSDKSSTSTTNGAAASNTSAPSSDQKTKCGENYLDTSKTYTVTFSTNKGDFVVTLDPKNSPIGSAHLASLVSSGFYDNLTFHRIVKGFVIQGGDPQGNGSGSSDCSVVSEKLTRDYKTGDFAWAKTATAPNGSAGSQFFIVTADSAASALTDQYGSAGTVTSGMDVVMAIEEVETGPGDAPLENVVITKATLSES